MSPLTLVLVARLDERAGRELISRSAWIRRTLNAFTLTSPQLTFVSTAYSNTSARFGPDMETVSVGLSRYF
jgi:hypothetical protein